MAVRTARANLAIVTFGRASTWPLCRRHGGHPGPKPIFIQHAHTLTEPVPRACCEHASGIPNFANAV
eukprot:11210842-Lingulodinium_polyedra.AAC.1